MVNVVWPVVSSVLSTAISGGIVAIYKALHNRFNKIEKHLKEQDRRINRIEQKLPT